MVKIGKAHTMASIVKLCRMAAVLKGKVLCSHHEDSLTLADFRVNVKIRGVSGFETYLCSDCAKAIDRRST